MALLAYAIPAFAADYNMEQGNGHTLTVTEPFYIYDDGGPTGYATKGFEGSVTLIPGLADKAVKINSIEFAVVANRLYVYNGREINTDNALGNASGYFVGTGPKDIVSEAEDGSMTIRFGGSKLGNGVTGTTIQGFKIEVSLADKPQAQVEPLSGTYRVGPSAEARFRNLTELQKALEQGIGAPVTIELEDNNFAEALLIKDLVGLSETNTLTITSVGGKPDNCIISGPATPLDDTGILCIDNSPYVTVRNITVATNEGNGSRYPYAGLHLRNGSNHCTVTGCLLRSPVSNSSTNDNRTYVVLAADCDNTTIINNRVEGGYYGIYAGVDPETTEGSAVTGLVVRGNDIISVPQSSVRLHTCAGFVLDGNTLTPGATGRKSANHIDIFKPAGSFAITANKILAEQSAESTCINLRAGTGSEDASAPAVIANNVIAYPRATAPYTYGIFIDMTNKNLVVAHNSINIRTTATSVRNIYGIAFNGTAPAKGTAASIVNNVIRTGASGVPLRPWNDSHYANLTFGHNVYYAENGMMDGDNKTFADYQAATGDDTSLWLEADYMSDSDLHLRSVERSMFVPRLSAVTADMAGTDRTDPTTAGAYEYEMPAPDAPFIAEGYPQVGTPTDAGIPVKTKWTIGGSLYIKAVRATEEAPVAADLKTLAPTAIDADKEIVSTLTGLQPSTEYRAYCLVVSALGAESAVVASDPFTTPEEIADLDALIFWQDEPFTEGQTVELMAYVEGGKEPYTYSWVDQRGEEVSTADSYSYTAEVNRSMRLTVRSADGQEVVCKDDIPVITSELLKATFDDLYLEAESNWMYDQVLATGGYYTDHFYSGSFEFTNMSMPSYVFWSGYGYSNETSTEFKTLADQMRNVVGAGADKTAAYGVCYAYGAPTTMNLSVPETGVTVPGLYVTNAAYTLNSILNGDGYASAFVDGDYQEVIFEGMLGETTTGTVTVNLADYRDGKRSVLTDWQWVDLSPLGRVTSLKFTLAGTQTDKIPAYVCLDEIGASKPDGIAEVAMGSDARIILATDDCIAVTGVEGAYTLSIYSTDGICRASHRMEGAGAVSIADLPAGIYVARVEGAPALRFAR